MARVELRKKISGLLLIREIARNARQGGHSMPFSQAKTISILYDATSDNDCETMKNYVRLLMSEGKDVLALGYYNQNELPGSRLMKLGLDYFSKKSLSWKMKPSNAIVQNFISRKADILILFNTYRSIPLLYIAHASRATFKIGRYDKACSGVLDFMIKIESPCDLKKMLGHVGHYLQLIKNEKN